MIFVFDDLTLQVCSGIHRILRRGLLLKRLAIYLSGIQDWLDMSDLFSILKNIFHDSNQAQLLLLSGI